MEVRIRPAQRTDAAFLGWVMLAAARSHVEKGHWDVSIARPEPEVLRFLETLTLSGAPHLCHWSTFLVAELDGRPASALCGYDPEAMGMEPLVAAMIETNERLGVSEAERKASFARSAPFLSCAPDNAEGAWIVENVATIPECRGRGLTNRLLKRILEEGRKRGHSRSQIGVLIGNTAAQRAYEGVGFKVVDEKRTPEFEATFGCPGIRRLLQDL